MARIGMRWAVEEALDTLDEIGTGEHDWDRNKVAELVAAAREEINNFLSYGEGGANFTSAQYLDALYTAESALERLQKLGEAWRYTAPELIDGTVLAQTIYVIATDALTAIKK
jgi:hypothetical protein